jgi:hypothetical protein
MMAAAPRYFATVAFESKLVWLVAIALALANSVSLSSHSHLTLARILLAFPLSSHSHPTLISLTSRSHLISLSLSLPSHSHLTLFSLSSHYLHNLHDLDTRFTLFECITIAYAICIIWIIILHYLNTRFTLFTLFEYTTYAIWAQSYFIKASIFGYLTNQKSIWLIRVFGDDDQDPIVFIGDIDMYSSIIIASNADAE